MTSLSSASFVRFHSNFVHCSLALSLYFTYTPSSHCVCATNRTLAMKMLTLSIALLAISLCQINARLISHDLPAIATASSLQSPALLKALMRARTSSSTESNIGSDASTVTSFATSAAAASVPSMLVVSPLSSRSATFKDDFNWMSGFDSNSIDQREPEVPVIPFTRVQGAARFPSLPATAIHHHQPDQQGVGPAVSFVPIASSAKSYAKQNVEPLLSSELHPVYMKPPVDFKPVLYASRRMDGQQLPAKPDNVASETPTVASPVRHPSHTAQRLPYPYPNGLSSWMLGGLRGVQRGGYWERLGSDQSLVDSGRPSSATRLTPAAQSVWFVQSVRDQPVKPEASSTIGNNPSRDNIELVSLEDDPVGEKDVYDASPSTIHQVSVRPSPNQFKFMVDSKQDLMTSASQKQVRRA